MSSGFNIKVFERNNRTAKNTLVKSHPFKKISCQRTSCKLCSTRSKVNCKTCDTVYRISCGGKDNQGKRCESIEYIGETSRSLSERYVQHWKMLKSNCESTKKSFFTPSCPIRSRRLDSTSQRNNRG